MDVPVLMEAGLAGLYGPPDQDRCRPSSNGMWFIGRSPLTTSCQCEGTEKKGGSACGSGRERCARWASAVASNARQYEAVL